MAIWEAHTCLPLNPDASFAPLLTYRECGVRYVSINIGMDMTPLDQVMTVIAGFRATIAAHPQELVLATTVQALAQNSAVCARITSMRSNRSGGRLSSENPGGIRSPLSKICV